MTVHAQNVPSECAPLFVQVGDVEDLLGGACGLDVVAIDEVQFFDWEITDVCEELAEHDKRVVVAGLDMDFRGEPFGPMPLLMALAEEVDNLHAICMVCGAPATRTQRLIDGQPAAYGASGFGTPPVTVVGGATVATMGKRLGARLVDRLVEVCRPVHMTGKSRRGAKGREAGA